jgi:hypothetical protein
LESREGLGIFLFTTASRPALGAKRQGHEADHSPPSSAEEKNAWSYTSTPPIRLHGVVLNLKTCRDNFTVYIIIIIIIIIIIKPFVLFRFKN